MIKQYGAIPFIRGKEGVKVVLVTSASGFWIFPKGNFEEKHGSCGTAQLEAFEEAGVKGVIYPHQIYRANATIRSGKKVRLMLYPLEVVQVFDKWPEDQRRKRVIVSLMEAEKLIDSDGLKHCLGVFARDFMIDE